MIYYFRFANLYLLKYNRYMEAKGTMSPSPYTFIYILKEEKLFLFLFF